MVVIPVVAVCCIGGGDAGRILPFESFPGLIKAGGVHLQGQRLLCGQELGEKRQPWAEFGEAFRARQRRGSEAINASKGWVTPLGWTAVEGESGWAPIHISASGPPDAGRPSKPAIAVVEPHA